MAAASFEMGRNDRSEARALGRGALVLSGIFTLSACTTYRAYAGDQRPAREVVTLECDPEGVSVVRVDGRAMSGWSEFELLPGTHQVSAELYWTRLERVVEGPEKTASFVAKIGKRYRCVFDVDEKQPDWSLAIVPDDAVSWKARTFHGARSWRTPDGNCVVWDKGAKGCLGGAARTGDAARDVRSITAEEKSANESDAIAP